jgi:putative hydrolase of the HAD superfamily
MMKKYPTVLFDWGGTVMYDDPALTNPMVGWPRVEVIDGIADVLKSLYASGRQIVIATAASISDENEIRGALARVKLDGYFSRIYCFKNTGLPKGKAFYRHILRDLKIPSSNALMVGDSFEKDVYAANAVGMFAVWFNPISDERLNGKLHMTVQSMQELGTFFKTLDQQLSTQP